MLQQTRAHPSAQEQFKRTFTGFKTKAGFVKVETPTTSSLNSWLALQMKICEPTISCSTTRTSLLFKFSMVTELSYAKTCHHLNQPKQARKIFLMLWSRQEPTMEWNPQITTHLHLQALKLTTQAHLVNGLISTALNLDGSKYLLPPTPKWCAQTCSSTSTGQKCAQESSLVLILDLTQPQDTSKLKSTWEVVSTQLERTSSTQMEVKILGSGLAKQHQTSCTTKLLILPFVIPVVTVLTCTFLMQDKTQLSQESRVKKLSGWKW